MTKQEIENSLRSAIVAELRLEDVRPEDIGSHTPLFGEEGLQLDSLDAVELVVIVEKHFGVVIESAEEVQSAFASVSGLADFILARRQSA